MSSIVKYNRVVVNAEKKVLLNNNSLHNAQDKLLVKVDKQEIDTSYPELAKRASQQAKDIIMDAQDKAKQIIIDAQIEAAKAVEIAKKKGHSQGYSEGYNEGYEQGLVEGRDQGRAEYQNLIEEAEQLKQKRIDDYQKLYKLSEENMLMLAIDIARKIIGDALENDDKAYTKMAYNALKLIKGQRKVQLKVSTQDFPQVLENKDFLISKLEGIEDIDIVEDTFLDRGSCIIDTGNGVIDGSAKTQIERIESTLTELVSSIL